VHALGNPVRLEFCWETRFMRIAALLFIFFILASLASALYYLIKDKGQSDRVVKMLTVRVALSLVLFVLLMGGYYFGFIPQNGLR
jgi:multisubunit Na+/H+ antiporter MnhF subunit